MPLYGAFQRSNQRIRSDTHSFAGILDNSASGGKALLFSVYLAKTDQSQHQSIRPENGRRSAELKALLLDELAKPDTLARRSGLVRAAQRGAKGLC